jgi:N-acetylglucosamine malate deacetylase 2
MMGVDAGVIFAALAGRATVEQKVMIIVAHPDDETIGMGAQLSRFRDALLLHITDGAPRDGRDAAAHGFATTADYALARRVELAAALEAGKANGVRAEVLGVVDQEACANLAVLTERVVEHLRAERPEAIFVQPYEGGHPDHDAAAFAVWAACRLIQAERRSAPAVIEMSAYHAAGTGLATGMFLPARRTVRMLTLTPADRSRKRLMIDCFISQRELLAGFNVAVESFREVPDYDFALPPHPGELHYERLGWNITGALWRRHAKAAADALGLRLP